MTSGRYFGLRKSALIEIVAYLGTALLLDTLFWEGSHYWNVSPHPFWPIVLLISVQYGTSEGLAAAVAASLALLSGKLPPQSLSQDLYDYIFFICKNPLLWVTSAVVLGGLRRRHAIETHALREELLSTRHVAEEVGTAYKQMATLKEKLEERVAGQLKTAIRMYEAARGMDRLEPAQVLNGVLHLVRVVMNPEKFSLFLLKNGRLELAVEEAWDTTDSYATAFSSQSALYQAVIGGQRCLCCVKRDEDRTLSGEGMLAAPLVHPETGEIVGMLKIEKLGFLDLNLSSVQTFKVLTEWIATAYSNALRYESALSNQIFDESTSLFSYSFFDRQTAFLSGLAQRVGFDVSMVVLRLDNVEDLTEEQRVLLPNVLGSVVRTSLRRTDLAFDYRQARAEHFIVLPNTSLHDSQIVCDKLLNQLHDSLPSELRHVQFSTRVQAIYRHDRSKDNLGTEALLVADVHRLGIEPKEPALHV